MLELWFIIMFVMQCVVVASLCWMMVPSRGKSRSRSRSESSAGSSWSDEMAEEAAHLKLTARKRKSMRRRMQEGIARAKKAAGKAASAKASASNEPRPPDTPPPRSTAAGSASQDVGASSTPRPPSNDFPPSLVHNVTTYVSTKSGRAFHLEKCAVARYRIQDTDHWTLCQKCFPIVPIRFPKYVNLLCVEGTMHSERKRCDKVAAYGKVTYKVPCQSCISTIEH